MGRVDIAKPVQRPGPPIGLGGRHPGVRQIRQFLDEEGRYPAESASAKRIYIAVDRGRS